MGQTREPWLQGGNLWHRKILPATLLADLHSDGTFDIVNNGLAAAHLPVGEKFTAKLSIPGKHNVPNAPAAAAVGLLLGENTRS